MFLALVAILFIADVSLNDVSITFNNKADPAKGVTRKNVLRKILKAMTPHVPDIEKSVWLIKIVTNDFIKTSIYLV